jgi:hypothetical protein
VHHILHKTNKRNRLELAIDRRLRRLGDNRDRRVSTRDEG